MLTRLLSGASMNRCFRALCLLRLTGESCQVINRRLADAQTRSSLKLSLNWLSPCTFCRAERPIESLRNIAGPASPGQAVYLWMRSKSAGMWCPCKAAYALNAGG